MTKHYTAKHLAKKSAPQLAVRHLGAGAAVTSVALTALLAAPGIAFAADATSQSDQSATSGAVATQPTGTAVGAIGAGLSSQTGSANSTGTVASSASGSDSASDSATGTAGSSASTDVAGSESANSTDAGGSSTTASSAAGAADSTESTNGTGSADATASANATESTGSTAESGSTGTSGATVSTGDSNDSQSSASDASDDASKSSASNTDAGTSDAAENAGSAADAGTTSGDGATDGAANSENAAPSTPTASTSNTSSDEQVSQPEVISDGVYTIVSALDPNKVLDIPGASDVSGAAIQLYDKNGTLAQDFYVTRKGDGSYEITNVGSGLALDVPGASPNGGTRLQQYTPNGSAAQRWRITSNGDGTYTITSVASGLAIDVPGADSGNGVALQQFASNGTAAQKFKFVLSSNVLQLDEGIYNIASAKDPSKVLDVISGSDASGALLDIYNANSTLAQDFYFTPKGGGWYEIRNVGSNLVLDVAGASRADSVQMEQYAANDTDAQRWLVMSDGNGSYVIVNKASGNVLDIRGAGYYNGNAVQQYSYNGTDAQKFLIQKAAKQFAEVADGMYEIQSAVNANSVLDLAGGELKDGTNIEVFDRNGSDSQKFQIERQDNGWYLIRSVQSGKVLDVDGAGTGDGTNVWAYSQNGTDAQMWKFLKFEDGSYAIINKNSGKALDIPGALLNNNLAANIQQYDPNGTVAQRFVLNDTEYSAPIADGYYVIASAQNDNMVLDVTDQSLADEANVELWSYLWGKNQEFYFQYMGNGFYKIQMAHSGKYLDVYGAGTTPGTNVQQWSGNDSDAQLWRVVPVDGKYALVSKCGGLVLDITGDNTSDGANVQVYTANDSMAQRFSLERDRTLQEGVSDDVASAVAPQLGNVKHDWTNESNNYSELSLHDMAQLLAQGDVNDDVDVIQKLLYKNDLLNGSVVKTFKQVVSGSSIANMASAILSAWSDLGSHYDYSNDVLGVGYDSATNTLAAILFDTANVADHAEEVASNLVANVSAVWKAAGIGDSVEVTDGLAVGDKLTTNDIEDLTKEFTTNLLKGEKGKLIDTEVLEAIFAALPGNSSALVGVKNYSSGSDTYHYEYWLDGTDKLQAFLDANAGAKYGDDIVVNYGATLTWGTVAKSVDPADEVASSVAGNVTTVWDNGATVNDALVAGDAVPSEDAATLSDLSSNVLLKGEKGTEISQSTLEAIFKLLPGNSTGLQGSKSFSNSYGSYHYVYWLDGTDKLQDFLDANKGAKYGDQLKVNYSATLTWGAPVEQATSTLGGTVTKVWNPNNATVTDALTDGSALPAYAVSDLAPYVPSTVLTGEKGTAIGTDALTAIFNTLPGNASALTGSNVYLDASGNGYYYEFWLAGTDKLQDFLDANKDAKWGDQLKIDYEATLKAADNPYATGSESGLRFKSVTVTPIDGMTDETIRGVDVSCYQALIDAGVKFYDYEGNEASIFDVLKQSGVNWVRLRLWNDPYNAAGETYGGGANDEATLVKLATEATQAGLKVLADFHYSDFWADPAKQELPKAWKELSARDLDKELYLYTSKVLKDLKAAGADVEMVSIGNEVTRGVMGLIGTNGGDFWQSAEGDVSAKRLATASRAVRAAMPDAKIAVHLEQMNDGMYRKIMTVFQNNGVDYDILGVSYYPFWGVNTGNLTSIMNMAKNEYGKQVVVMETAWPNSIQNADGTANNISWEVGPYSMDPQGQVDEIEAMYQALVQGGGLGAFYWEPAWIPVKAGWNNWNYDKYICNVYGTGWASKNAIGYAPDDEMYWTDTNGVTTETWGGSSWDNNTLFDFNGHPLQSLMVYYGMLHGYTTGQQA